MMIPDRLSVNSFQDDDESSPLNVHPTRHKLHASMKNHMMLVSLMCAALVVGAVVVAIITSEGPADGDTPVPPPPCPVCHPNATYKIVESIPQGLEDLLIHERTHTAWIDLISSAKHTLHIAAFYMTLTHADDQGGPYPPGPNNMNNWGVLVYNAIVDAVNRGVSVYMAINPPSLTMPDTDAKTLGAMPGVTVYWSDFPKLVGGVLHTKFIVSDETDFYVGSANMDWRALSQVKEMGIVVKDCPYLGNEMMSVFYTYRDLANTSSIPKWPESYRALSNIGHMANLTLNGSPGLINIASAPLSVCPHDRTNDIDQLLSVIYNSTTSVSISVMDYAPYSAYSDPKYYWGTIDTALRSVAYRGVHVQFMMSQWNHTNPTMYPYLKSLAALPNITVKLFVVPEHDDMTIPYTRVNHAKFMVTDKNAFVHTSNWAADYFLTTAGVSFVSNSADMIAELQAAFDRDFNSQYAVPVNEI